MEKYVDNDVFVFDCALKWDLSRINDITIYTKPFPSKGFVTTDEELDAAEEIVAKKYFTQERINELKQELIQRIQECENPFDICCVDMDGGYNVTEDMLFNVEK
jgi:hypothetical protein